MQTESMVDITKAKNEISQKQIERGDIWLTDLNFLNTKHTCIQQGLRPVIVISNRKCNQHSPVITIVPITTKSKTSLPTHVKLENRYLQANSIALTEQAQAVDRYRLVRKMTSCDRETIHLINNAIKIQLNLQSRTDNNATNMMSVVTELFKANTALNNLDTLTAKKILVDAIKSVKTHHMVNSA